MLPKVINAEAGNHTIITDRRAGHFNLLFVSRHALKDDPFHPHWVRECADEHSLMALCRWFAVRRDHWQVWGDIAEKIGIDAFWSHMASLLEAEPIEQVTATTITPLAEPCDVALGEMLLGRRGLRSETLYVHSFVSPEARARFLDWFYKDAKFAAAQPLLGIGWSEGTDELGRVLDEVAGTAARASEKAPRGQRRYRSCRPSQYA